MLRAGASRGRSLAATVIAAGSTKAIDLSTNRSVDLYVMIIMNIKQTQFYLFNSVSIPVLHKSGICDTSGCHNRACLDRLFSTNTGREASGNGFRSAAQRSSSMIMFSRRSSATTSDQAYNTMCRQCLTAMGEGREGHEDLGPRPGRRPHSVISVYVPSLRQFTARSKGRDAAKATQDTERQPFIQMEQGGGPTLREGDRAQVTWRKPERKNGRITVADCEWYGRGATSREETIFAWRRGQTPSACCTKQPCPWRPRPSTAR